MLKDMDKVGASFVFLGKGMSKLPTGLSWLHGEGRQDTLAPLLMFSGDRGPTKSI